MMTPEELAEIKERHSRATPGPWIRLTEAYRERMHAYRKRTGKWYHGTERASTPISLIAQNAIYGEPLDMAMLPERADRWDLNEVVGIFWDHLPARAKTTTVGMAKNDEEFVAGSWGDIKRLTEEVERLWADREAPEERSPSIMKRNQEPLIYVAGPYASNPAWGTRGAIIAAERLRAMNVIPVIPHLAMLWDLVAPSEPDEFLRMDLALVERCDGLVRLHGDSAGADAEERHARDCGVEVFGANLACDHAWWGNSGKRLKMVCDGRLAYRQGYRDGDELHCERCGETHDPIALAPGDHCPAPRFTVPPYDARCGRCHASGAQVRRELDRLADLGEAVRTEARTS